jgi:hypothetical protein
MPKSIDLGIVLSEASTTDGLHLASEPIPNLVTVPEPLVEEPLHR